MGLQLCDVGLGQPGNIRELQNTIERALILAQNGTLWFDLPTSGGTAATASDATAPGAPVLSDLEVRQRERDNLLAALKETNWKIHGPGGAAELLGLRPTTLIYRIKKLGLKRPGRPQP